MNSVKYFLVVFFLFVVSVNVFAEYDVQMNWSEVFTANPNPGPGPDNVNAYYSKGPMGTGTYGSHEILNEPAGPPYDVVELEFELENLSTNDGGEHRPVNPIKLKICSWRMTTGHSPTDYCVEFNYDGLAGSNDYTTATGIFSYGRKLVWKVPIEANGIENLTEFEVKQISIHVEFENSGQWEYYLEDPITGGGPNVEVYLPSEDLDPPIPIINDIEVYLDPITCFNPVTGIEAANANPYVYDPTKPIRCDLEDTNTITFEVYMKDINASVAALGHHVEIESVEMFCATERPYERVMHYQSGCDTCYYRPPWAYQSAFRASCEFLHYDNTPPNQPMHTDCEIYDPLTEQYSAPPNFIAIPDCPDGTLCPLQDKNIYYNTNLFEYKKFFNPTEFSLFNLGDSKVFRGTVTNAKTGGDFRCSAVYVYYNIVDAGGTIIRGPFYETAIQDGTNQGLHNGDPTKTSGWYAKILKLDGHDAYVEKNGTFMPSSPFVRPLKPWTVELPISSRGIPWDGATPKDILYADVNITSYTWDVAQETLVIDGSDADHYLGTSPDADGSKLFFVDFPITKGFYHQFLTAAAMNAKLRGYDGWIFDMTKDVPITNIRLITILNPNVYDILGDACYTDPSWDILCWWNWLSYNVSNIDLNANEDIEFVLRLRNPFDFNEFFDLTYETNESGNARIDFEPQQNFVPPFTSGEFGYKYAKMILRNPAILHGDANYNIIDTSVNHPYVWDNLDVQFKTFSHNLRLENFTVMPEKEYYDIGDVLDFSLSIKNTGDIIEKDINFLVVSSMDSTEIFHAPNGTNIAPGDTLTFTQTLPAVPYKGVFEIEATVEPVAFEHDLSDNAKKIVIITGYEGDVSNLSETNYLVLLFLVLIVLFLVRKK
ncbi:hypothetical protein KKB11_00680 [Candidatus Micrarchaeota archaeon]|nr:hypothetical protein [Candidatus Micrarchaeota archaeon]